MNLLRFREARSTGVTVSLLFLVVKTVCVQEIKDCFERSPVIAAVQNNALQKALKSPVEIIFNLRVSLLEIENAINKVHLAGKKIFIHIDLADGIGKDKTGVEYLAKMGVDGIISTRPQLIRYAHEIGLITVQRFFALDSKGVDGIGDMLETAKPDLIEIMPGIASKVINRFVTYGIPIIAGGLIETKQEVTEALKNGAEAISTGKEELWYI